MGNCGKDKGCFWTWNVQTENRREEPGWGFIWHNVARVQAPSFQCHRQYSYLQLAHIFPKSSCSASIGYYMHTQQHWFKVQLLKWNADVQSSWYLQAWDTPTLWCVTHLACHFSVPTWISCCHHSPKCPSDSFLFHFTACTWPKPVPCSVHSLFPLKAAGGHVCRTALTCRCSPHTQTGDIDLIFLSKTGRNPWTPSHTWLCACVCILTLWGTVLPEEPSFFS